MTKAISFTLNGQPVVLETDPRRSLLWVLRTDLGLTGAKLGCGEGLCGACTVLVDGAAVSACQMTVGAVTGKTVTTIEGLARNGTLHPVQQAFVQHEALQCGFCTPGMILKAVGLLNATPQPTRDQIVAAMDDNLCRCGAHGRIVAAIETAAQAAKGGRS